MPATRPDGSHDDGSAVGTRRVLAAPGDPDVSASSRIPRRPLDVAAHEPPGPSAGLTAAEYLARRAVFDVRDYGAVGDGTADDTDALYAACRALRAAGGGTLRIPPGVYRVGRQTATRATGRSYAWRPAPIVDIRNCPGPVVIEGAGAVLRLAPGLRYGSFHPVTGRPHAPAALPFTALDYRAAPVEAGMVTLIGNASVTVRGLELDGRSGTLVVGGAWGDTGIQVPATGLFLFGNARAVVEDVYTHHHGLDGYMAGVPGLTEASPPTPHTFTSVRSEHNGRNACSWIGGRGFTWMNPTFSHSGRGAVRSSPGAGLDIEAEGSVCRDGLVVGGEAVNNAGPGVVADSGDGGYTTFRRLTVWAGASWAVFARKPRLVFEDCTLFGQTTVCSAARPEDGTRLVRCHLEDRDHPTYGAVYRSGMTLDAPNAYYFEADGCEIVGRVNKPIYLLAAPDRARAARLRDTRLVVMNATLPPGDFQVYLSNVVLTRVRVVDALTGPAPRPGYYVETGMGNVVEGGVVVPATVRYGNAVSGAVGELRRTR